MSGRRRGGAWLLIGSSAVVAVACNAVLGIQEYPTESAEPVADAAPRDTGPSDAAAVDGESDAGAPDAEAATPVDAADAARAPDAADSSPPEGTALALGSSITIIGITTQGMVIYSDGTNYCGVSLNGGPITVIAPVAGVTKLLVAGAYAVYWGPAAPEPTNLAAMSFCPGCTFVSPPSNTVVVPEAPLVTSPDGSFVAFTATSTGNDASARKSLYALGPSDTGIAIVENVSCVRGFAFATNDDLVATYCDDSGDAGRVLRMSVFAGGSQITSQVVSDNHFSGTAPYWNMASSGEWLFVDPLFIPANSFKSVVIHVPDGATHMLPEQTDCVTFDRAGGALYYTPYMGSGLERFSLKDFSTTQITASIGGAVGSCYLNGTSPDDRFVEATDKLVSVQTGAVTQVPSDDFTDDWSFAAWTEQLSDDAGAFWNLWVSPVGGPERVALGTARDTFILNPLSNSTVLVRNASLVNVFDANGKVPPVLLTDSLAATPFAWALAPDRKRGTYATEKAPAGLYVIPVP